MVNYPGLEDLSEPLESFWDKREQADVVFMRRRLKTTWAWEQPYFYFSAQRLLFGFVDDWEPSFHIRPRNLLPDYRKHATEARTKYLDKAIFNHRAGKFRLEPLWVPAWDLAKQSFRDYKSHAGSWMEFARVSGDDIKAIVKDCVEKRFFFAGKQSP